MRTMEATILVDADHRATLQLPPDVEPGTHRIVVVIEEPTRKRARLTFSAHHTGPWPEGFSVRREELYGDDGR